MAAEIILGTIRLAIYLSVVCFGGIILNRLFFNSNNGLLGFQIFLMLMTIIWHIVYLLGLK